MKDIYGEDYIIISKRDYNKLLDRIEELEKLERENRAWTIKVTETMHKATGDNIKFLLNQCIK